MNQKIRINKNGQESSCSLMRLSEQILNLFSRKENFIGLLPQKIPFYNVIKKVINFIKLIFHLNIKYFIVDMKKFSFKINCNKKENILILLN